jgi:IS30 family transposase
LTWDRGKERAQRAELNIDAVLQVYFATRTTHGRAARNEKTNVLLRQDFPNGQRSRPIEC